MVLFVFQNFTKKLLAKFGTERLKESQIQCIGSKERQGPTLSVRFTEVSVKRDSTVNNLQVNLVSTRAGIGQFCGLYSTVRHVHF